MNVFDVDALLVLDTRGNVLLKKVFALQQDVIDKVIARSLLDTDPMYLHADKLVLCAKADELITVLVSRSDNNEILLGHSFDQFHVAMKTTLKKCTKEAVYKKYDLLYSLFDAFVYKGMIVENKTDKLLENIPKRSFEAIDGMKVTKGFASVLNNASKSFTRYI